MFEGTSASINGVVVVGAHVPNPTKAEIYETRQFILASLYIKKNINVFMSVHEHSCSLMSLMHLGLDGVTKGICQSISKFTCHSNC